MKYEQQIPHCLWVTNPTFPFLQGDALENDFSVRGSLSSLSTEVLIKKKNKTITM